MYKTRNNRHYIMLRILFVLLLLQGNERIFSQDFNVKSFRILANDVSAFVTPVFDLNKNACALIKITGGKDCEYTSPLGIVKRKEDVGETWIYLPAGSRKITLKHPKFGIIRDYKFNTQLESRITYEMILSYPLPKKVIMHDTIYMEKSIIDTVLVEHKKEPVPLSINIIATIGIQDNEPLYGIMLAALHRHGIFLHSLYDFKSVGKTIASCDKEGNIIGENGNQPYYTGKTRHTNYAIMTGAIHRINKNINLYEGIGYWKKETAWQLSESDNSQYVLNKDLTHKGIALELGFIMSWNNFTTAASLITSKGKYWMPSIGIGYRF